ncbi:hypothetical protein ACO0SA_002780 [Hanseniaspora valbyensis]
MNSVYKRHDADGGNQTNTHNSHYANLSYGTLIFEIMGAYLIVLFIFRKIYYYFNMFRSSTEKNSKLNLKLKKLIDNFINLNPYLHIPLILIISFAAKFFDFEITKMSVYYKKIARLSYVLTFTNLFLVIPRSNYFIFMTYLDSIRLHVWLSVFILLLSTLHSFCFIIKWLISGILIKKLFKPQNFIGLIIFVITFILLAISLTDYRRRHYENFYLIHQLGMLSFIILTILHADPHVFTPFGILNTGFLLVMVINKIINNSAADGDDPFVVKEVKDYGSLKIIKFTNNKINNLNNDYMNEDPLPLKFVPGSHLRLHESNILNWKYWLKPSHPYTLVSNNELILKKNEFSNFNNVFKPNTPLNLVGLFNPNESIECMLKETKRKRVSIVTGGSGISFALPILRTLLIINQKKDKDADLVSLYWSIRKFEDAFIVVDFLENLIDSEAIGVPQFFLKINVTGNDDQIKEEQKELLKTQLNQYKGSLEFDIEYNNRFVVSSIAPEEEFVSYSADFKEWVICCGPSVMISDCKQFVNATNYKIDTDSVNSRNYIEFISEIYEF